ncbi:MAG: 16S rRNA (adenine(1518)-N(6)/adenine(1519)-N(6))-dimethyltransferase RsmA [Oscillospiraceae bacterium]|nr:16S rRNA (adenine(1518)-N(6)/adenine(1519)-N(6))-dimethyltransferase RsmA [Oscillospiraceae bacterium]
MDTIKREKLDSIGFKFSKAMGQNFLTDSNIPEKTVRLSNIDQSCGVLEIGPGIGALTLPLSAVAGKVVAVELDEKLLPILSDTFAHCENVEFVAGDILKLDVSQLLKDKFVDFRYCVCANLPYNITSPILTKLIDSDLFEQVTVMVQREVARRMCALPGTSDYSAFSVFINYHTEPTILFDVPPECFIPRPKVYSSVVLMRTRTEKRLSKADEGHFFRIVRAAFGQRRKTLVNALYAAFGSKMTKADIMDIIMFCGFDPRIRGETLGIEEFIKISKQFQLT